MRTACTASLLQGRCTSGSRVLAQTLVLALSLAALIPAGCAPLDGLNAAREYHSHLGQGSDSIPGAYQGSQDGSDSMPGSSQPGSTEKQWGTGSASTAVGPSSEAERCAEHGCIVHLLRPVKGVEAHRPLSKRLQLCTRGIRALAAIKEPLALVAAVGPYHSGKSFLLNVLLNSTMGFEVGTRPDPETHGLWLRILPRDGPRAKGGARIGFLDTEGLFGEGGPSQTYDAKVFALATLLSSHLLFNTLRTLGDSQSVAQLADLAKRANVFNLNTWLHSGVAQPASGPKRPSEVSSQDLRIGGEVEDEHGDWEDTTGTGTSFDFSLLKETLDFPALTWVVQGLDIELPPQATPMAYLSFYLEAHATAGDHSLETLFRKGIACRTLRSPADLNLVRWNTGGAGLGAHEELWGVLHEAYIADVRALQRHVLENLEPKGGGTLTGPALAELLPILVHFANEDFPMLADRKLPELLADLHLDLAFEAAVEFFHARVSAFLRPSSSPPPPPPPSPLLSPPPHAPPPAPDGAETESNQRSPPPGIVCCRERRDGSRGASITVPEEVVPGSPLAQELRLVWEEEEVSSMQGSVVQGNKQGSARQGLGKQAGESASSFPTAETGTGGECHSMHTQKQEGAQSGVHSGDAGSTQAVLQRLPQGCSGCTLGRFLEVSPEASGWLEATYSWGDMEEKIKAAAWEAVDFCLRHLASGLPGPLANETCRHKLPPQLLSESTQYRERHAEQVARVVHMVAREVQDKAVACVDALRLPMREEELDCLCQHMNAAAGQAFSGLLSRYISPGPSVTSFSAPSIPVTSTSSSSTSSSTATTTGSTRSGSTSRGTSGSSSASTGGATGTSRQDTTTSSSIGSGRGSVSGEVEAERAGLDKQIRHWCAGAEATNGRLVDGLLSDAKAAAHLTYNSHLQRRVPSLAPQSADPHPPSDRDPHPCSGSGGPEGNAPRRRGSSGGAIEKVGGKTHSASVSGSGKGSGNGGEGGGGGGASGARKDTGSGDRAKPSGSHSYAPSHAQAPGTPGATPSTSRGWDPKPKFDWTLTSSGQPVASADTSSKTDATQGKGPGQGQEIRDVANEGGEQKGGGGDWEGGDGGQGGEGVRWWGAVPVGTLLDIHLDATEAAQRAFSAKVSAGGMPWVRLGHERHDLALFHLEKWAQEQAQRLRERNEALVARECGEERRGAVEEFLDALEDIAPFPDNDEVIVAKAEAAGREALGNFSWSGRSFEGSPAARRCLDSLEASVAQGQQQLRERNTRQMTVMFFRPLAAARQELRVLEECTLRGPSTLRTYQWWTPKCLLPWAHPWLPLGLAYEARRLAHQKMLQAQEQAAQGLGLGLGGASRGQEGKGEGVVGGEWRGGGRGLAEGSSRGEGGGRGGKHPPARRGGEQRPRAGIPRAVPGSVHGSVSVLSEKTQQRVISEWVKRELREEMDAVRFNFSLLAASLVGLVASLAWCAGGILNAVRAVHWGVSGLTQLLSLIRSLLSLPRQLVRAVYSFRRRVPGRGKVSDKGEGSGNGTKRKAERGGSFAFPFLVPNRRLQSTHRSGSVLHDLHGETPYAKIAGSDSKEKASTGKQNTGGGSRALGPGAQHLGPGQSIGNASREGAYETKEQARGDVPAGSTVTPLKGGSSRAVTPPRGRSGVDISTRTPQPNGNAPSFTFRGLGSGTPQAGVVGSGTQSAGGLGGAHTGGEGFNWGGIGGAGGAAGAGGGPGGGAGVGSPSPSGSSSGARMSGAYYRSSDGQWRRFKSSAGPK